MAKREALTDDLMENVAGGALLWDTKIRTVAHHPNPEEPATCIYKFNDGETMDSIRECLRESGTTDFSDANILKILIDGKKIHKASALELLKP